MRKILTTLAVAGLVVLACSVAPAQQPVYQAQADGPAAFMGLVNQWRAAHGRGPLAWDGNLAAFAARNNGVHTPGSSGGASQAWAGVGSYTQAFRMWAASPAHASIMLNAVQSAGISICPSGITANFR